MVNKDKALKKIQELQALTRGIGTSDKIEVVVKELEPLLEGNEVILSMLGTFLGNIGYASVTELGISLKWIEELITDIPQTIQIPETDRKRQLAVLQVLEFCHSEVVSANVAWGTQTGKAEEMQNSLWDSRRAIKEAIERLTDVIGPIDKDTDGTKVGPWYYIPNQWKSDEE